MSDAAKGAKGAKSSGGGKKVVLKITKA